MPAQLLFRVDAERNMARFYKIDVQPTLFGEWAVVREWGRIGQSGTVRSTSFATGNEAGIEFNRQLRAKTKRGYSANLELYGSPPLNFDGYIACGQMIERADGK